MAILYVAAAFVFFMWWVRGSFEPAVLIAIISAIIIYFVASNSLEEDKRNYTDYLSQKNYAAECEKKGNHSDDSAFDRVFGCLPPEKVIPKPNSANEIEFYALIYLIITFISFAPYLVKRHRARRLDRMLNGVTFLGKD